MPVDTDSQLYSTPVSISVADIMYLRMIPFWLSCGGGFQVRATVVESTTSPAKSLGTSLGPAQHNVIVS